MINPLPNPDDLNALPDKMRHAHQMQHKERFLKRELRRFNLTHRQQTIAELIVELSFGWCQEEVKIPKLDFFNELCGIPRSHAHTALRSLHGMRILTVTVKDSIASYKINQNPETWQAAPRLSRARIRNAINILKQFNGLCEKRESSDPKPEPNIDTAPPGEDLPNFNGRHDSHFLDLFVSESVTGTDHATDFPHLT